MPDELTVEEIVRLLEESRARKPHKYRVTLGLGVLIVNVSFMTDANVEELDAQMAAKVVTRLLEDANAGDYEIIDVTHTRMVDPSQLDD